MRPMFLVSYLHEMEYICLDLTHAEIDELNELCQSIDSVKSAP